MPTTTTMPFSTSPAQARPRLLGWVNRMPSAAITAPGGGKVGMTLGELQVLYPERADVGPDKYDEKAQHLRVRPAQEGAAVIDFALGADGRVGAWRVGRTPQVDYAEGCG